MRSSQISFGVWEAQTSRRYPEFGEITRVWVRDRFEKLETEIWEDTKNPVLALNQASPEILEKLAKHEDYVTELNAAVKELASHLEDKDLWYQQNTRYAIKKFKLYNKQQHQR